MYTTDVRMLCASFSIVAELIIVRGNYCEISPDLEWSAAVHFWTFLVRMDHSEVFSGESKIFYLVAFFSMKHFGGCQFWSKKYGKTSHRKKATR